MRNIIGIGEIIFFSIIIPTLFYLGDQEFYTFFPLVGGWIGIKTIGNYPQWSDKNFGRIVFYNFLILSFTNILFAVWLGFAFVGFLNLVEIIT